MLRIEPGDTSIAPPTARSPPVLSLSQRAMRCSHVPAMPGPKFSASGLMSSYLRGATGVPKLLTPIRACTPKSTIDGETASATSAGLLGSKPPPNGLNEPKVTDTMLVAAFAGLTPRLWSSVYLAKSAIWYPRVENTFIPYWIGNLKYLPFLPTLLSPLIIIPSPGGSMRIRFRSFSNWGILSQYASPSSSSPPTPAPMKARPAARPDRPAIAAMT